MPTIKKLKKRGRQSYRAAQRHSLYRLPEWRALSKYVRGLHPLCTLCECEGKVKESEHVHHIVSPFACSDEDERLRLLLDPCNLIALCATCHSLVHAGEKKIPPDVLAKIICGEYTHF